VFKFKQAAGAPFFGALFSMVARGRNSREGPPQDAGTWLHGLPFLVAAVMDTLAVVTVVLTLHCCEGGAEEGVEEDEEEEVQVPPRRGPKADLGVGHNDEGMGVQRTLAIGS
jgi:hypothetical protein